MFRKSTCRIGEQTACSPAIRTQLNINGCSAGEAGRRVNNIHFLHSSADGSVLGHEISIMASTLVRERARNLSGTGLQQSLILKAVPVYQIAHTT